MFCVHLAVTIDSFILLDWYLCFLDDGTLDGGYSASNVWRFRIIHLMFDGQNWLLVVDSVGKRCNRVWIDHPLLLLFATAAIQARQKAT